MSVRVIPRRASHENNGCSYNSYSLNLKTFAFQSFTVHDTINVTFAHQYQFAPFSSPQHERHIPTKQYHDHIVYPPLPWHKPHPPLFGRTEAALKRKLVPCGT